MLLCKFIVIHIVNVYVQQINIITGIVVDGVSGTLYNDVNL